MTKLATLIFSGQGSQYVGMGKELCEKYPLAREIFSRADECLNFSLSDLCFSGDDSELKATYNTQPALLTHSVALLEVWKPFLLEKGIGLDAVLGHSVGEYAALVAAGVLNFEDALKLTRWRGQYMQEAVPVGVGKMAAILMVEEKILRETCLEVNREDHVVSPANYNGPTQIVISGHKSAVDEVITTLEKKLGKVRAMELPVSAPFHCALMAPAADRLKAHLDATNFQNLKIPYIANIDAQKYPVGTLGGVVRQNLWKQIVGSVCWTQSVLQAEQNSLFIEMGPGKILKGLVKKICGSCKVIATDESSAETEFEEWCL